MMKDLGSKTQWGKIVAISMLNGERYYWMVKDEVVSMMPALVVEEKEL